LIFLLHFFINIEISKITLFIYPKFIIFKKKKKKKKKKKEKKRKMFLLTGTSSIQSNDPNNNKNSSEEPEELIPMENFSMVCKGVYRGAFPKKKNFPFLKKLGLKSIL